MASIIIKMALLSYKAEISALIKKGWVCGLKKTLFGQYGSISPPKYYGCSFWASTRRIIINR